MKLLSIVNNSSFVNVMKNSIKELRKDVKFDNEMLLEYQKGNINETEYYCSLIYRIPYKCGMKVIFIKG